MSPSQALPISEGFEDVEEYVDSLLQFATTSTLFQTLCGGVHILDFFTLDASLYDTILPSDWRSWFSDCGSMELLDLLMRDDLEALDPTERRESPPSSLVQYIKDIRRHSLRRSFAVRSLKQKTLPRHVAVGMIPKKIHEVINFADYVVNLADAIEKIDGQPITHFVDFGSGQNYLGRALASPPYNKHIIAVESREINISGARNMDVLARLAEREVVMRNKKLYRQKLDIMTPKELLTDKALRRAEKPQKPLTESVADLRPVKELEAIYKVGDGEGSVKYVQHSVADGDLSAVIGQISFGSKSRGLGASASDSLLALGPHPAEMFDGVVENQDSSSKRTPRGSTLAGPRVMAVSVHSCGNLSHHGIRSLLINQSVQAIAIVGCCYNLLTERLGPPTSKLPCLRPNLRPINARVERESAAHDPHGFPMSERLGGYDGARIVLNITARMMAVQAPQNWTEKESDSFFTRHYFRALLQRIFLDRGVVSKPDLTPGPGSGDGGVGKEGTDPVIIGSLRKGCYASFTTYVRGAMAKLTADATRGGDIGRKMAGITDDEIEGYNRIYSARKKEVSVMWSLMAFSAGVVESLIAVDRWQFLREHPDVVKDCWVEAVFDYQQSPRNLVVVGIKR